MPIREFQCRCGHRFETLVLPGEDESALTCPKCGGMSLERRMSVCSARVADGGGGTRSLGSACSTCSGGSCSTCK
ncbi:MAG: FmdB family zinc ribbon protein [Bacillota bacterium]|jgi:putative FmdB family regulatory protein